MTIIQNTPKLKVYNLDALPRGTGARYLECITAHNGTLIAKQWRRTPPKQYDVLIEMRGH